MLTYLKLTKDIVSIQIDDIKAFSEVATEQINIMLDIQKVFHVYGQMPDCEPIIPRQVFTESKAFFKCQRHGETKNIRVSIRITTGKFLISHLMTNQNGLGLTRIKGNGGPGVKDLLKK